MLEFNKSILWFTFAIHDSIYSFQVRILWMTTPRYLIESSLSRFWWSMTGLIPWQVCNLLPPPNNTNFEFHVVILPHFQINGKVLTSSDRFKSESDLKESDLGECEPAYILLRCGKNLGKYFMLPLKPTIWRRVFLWKTCGCFLQWLKSDGLRNCLGWVQ